MNSNQIKLILLLCKNRDAYSHKVSKVVIEQTHILDHSYWAICIQNKERAEIWTHS
jgi:hypothetical protein